MEDSNKLNGLECFYCKSNHLIQLSENKFQCKSCGHINYRPNKQIDTKFEIASDYLRQYKFKEADSVYLELYKSDDVNTKAQALFGRILSYFGIIFIRSSYKGNNEVLPSKAIFLKFDNEIESILDSDYYKEINNLSFDGKESLLFKIKELNKEYVEIRKKLIEEPIYDVFICVKISSTIDFTAKTNSFTNYAVPIFNELTGKNRSMFSDEKPKLKVFCSEITKPSSHYDSEIFAALAKSKMMLVIGESREHLESDWVQSEWQRWLHFMKKGIKKENSLITLFTEPFTTPFALNDNMVNVYRDTQDVYKKIFELYEEYERENVKKKETKKVVKDDVNVKTISLSNNDKIKYALDISNDGYYKESIIDLDKLEKNLFTSWIIDYNKSRVKNSKLVASKKFYSEFDEAIKYPNKELRNHFFKFIYKESEKYHKQNNNYLALVLLSLIIPYVDNEELNYEKLLLTVNNIAFYSFDINVLKIYENRELAKNTDSETIIECILQSINKSIKYSDDYFKELNNILNSYVEYIEKDKKNKYYEMIGDFFKLKKMFTLAMSNYKKINAYNSSIYWKMFLCDMNSVDDEDFYTHNKSKNVINNEYYKLTILNASEKGKENYKSIIELQNKRLKKEKKKKILSISSIIVSLLLIVFLYITFGPKVKYYDKNDGVIKEQLIWFSVDNIKIPSPPEIDGYSFVEWEEISNYNFKAKYEPNKYEIILNLDGGNCNEEKIEVRYGEYYELPIPTKEGYTFLGWYIDNNEVTSDYYSNLSDININAKWTEATYTISYDFDGGVCNNLPTEYNKSNMINLPTPTKEGYTFLGWHDENDKLIKTLEYKNYNLKAKWKVIIYTIIYNLDGGVCNNLPTEFNKISMINLPKPTKEGYTFLGWYDENDNLVNTVELKNYNLKAKWKVIKYTITYILNFGKCSNLPTEYYIFTNAKVLPEPTREGYTFLGWYDGINLNKSYIVKGELMKDILLEAKWEETIYTISYDLNGGICNNLPKRFTKFNTITLPTPTKEGYTFLGWYDENDNLVNTVELKNYNIKAKWTEATYSISYNLDGGTCANLPEEFSKSNIINLPTPTKNGHIFLGWFDVNNNLVNNLELKNYNLKAKWIKGDSESIYIGKYPQTQITDSTLINTLQNIKNTNELGYIEYNGNEYKEYDSNYYLVEPIKWRILEQNNNTYKLLSDVILDESVFYEDKNNRTINNNTIYPNNYEYSNIRAWLNGYDGTSYNVDNYQGVGFIDITFTEEERELINETLVDNSASTTHSPYNPYACNNTLDKVYLLSYQDVTNKYFTTEEERIAKVTDYAKARGVYVGFIIFVKPYYGDFWLRSPYLNDSNDVHYVLLDGDEYYIDSHNSFIGARPVLEITIK